MHEKDDRSIANGEITLDVIQSCEAGVFTWTLGAEKIIRTLPDVSEARKNKETIP